LKISVSSEPKTTDLGTEDISNGKGKMPAFKTMTPDQVKDLVAFIRSLKK
jgi:mono/diheme cytochrome c family protein